MIEKKSLKVAMVVANPIINDARVRKQAVTLHKNGVDLQLFGYGDDTDIKEINSIPLHIVKRASILHSVKKTLNSGEKIRTSIKSFLNKSKSVLFNNLFQFSVFLLLIVTCYIFGLMGLYNIFSSIGGIVFLACFGLIFLSFFIFFRPNILGRESIAIAYEFIAKLIYKELRKTNFDVIHAHDIIGLMAALKVKLEQPDVKLIWDAHELYTEVSYASTDVADFINGAIKKAAPQIDYFITINDSFTHLYKEKYPTLPDGFVLMNATRQATEVTVKSDLLRQSAGLNPDQNILLFQGGLVKGRGITQLLEAAPKLPINWTVQFMGNGRMEEEILKACKKYNINERTNGRQCIAIIPTVPYEELAQWTSGATIGCIPYENTNLNHLYCTPNKLWEYPNAGVPILATGLVEMKKMIEKHKTGKLLPIDFEAHDIVQAIEVLNSDELVELERNCLVYNKVENWEKYEPRLIGIYQDLKAI